VIEEILADAVAVAARAAGFIAARAGEAVAARGRCLIAVSGGSTPEPMLAQLSRAPIDWPRVHLFQVDERAAPEGDRGRNLTALRELLLTHVPSIGGVHPMPVQDPDLARAAAVYGELLIREAGNPPTLDLVHLGLGRDGHTASLDPAAPRLFDRTEPVVATGSFAGYRRLTLTLATINRARTILWVVTGGDKAAMLSRLRAGDASVPAGLVRRTHAWLLADRSAAGDGA
jgi:6-phosphogluconolactonase